ncbi:MAG: excisionase family DNA-binding protein [Deltaproteobacteria bacterium]|nr:excisionase family DNA-binding protein [Deltaproteobacteria bacterium]
MEGHQILTTTEAAALAGVAPTTLKRWADQGLLAFARTAGGHRRFQRGAVERLVRELAQPRAEPSGAPAADPPAEGWIRAMVAGPRHELEARLLGARDRLGRWCHVGDEVAAALVELGRRWACGELSIADEHVASGALMRALGRIGDMLPSRGDGPVCLLACADGDQHSLGLAMAELCVREQGWTPLWLGPRTPVDEIVRLVADGRVRAVALSASGFMDDPQALGALAGSAAGACRERGVGLALGGSGAWPTGVSYGDRLDSFAAFSTWLSSAGTR